MFLFFGGIIGDSEPPQWPVRRGMGDLEGLGEGARLGALKSQICAPYPVSTKARLSGEEGNRNPP